jgi:creatinine amidohydrolase
VSKIDHPQRGHDRPTHQLQEMTWPQAKLALEQAKLAIIPVGSTEQHGPHLRMATDTAIAEQLARRLADHLSPQLVVTPPIPLGVSYHHMDFPGSLTLSPETLQAILVDVVESLRHHGIELFFLLTGHGGNEATLEVLTTKLRFQRRIPAASLFYFRLVSDVIEQGVRSERWGHACEVETSLALYLKEDLVEAGQLAAGAVLPYPYPYSDRRAPAVTVPYAFAELTANGALGNAVNADREFGRTITEAFVERAGAFLRGFIADHGAATNPSPEGGG